jgi:hypothetical protein
LNFTSSTMWQQITGRIEVLEDAVRVEIELPWVMQLLCDTITKRIRGRGGVGRSAARGGVGPRSESNLVIRPWLASASWSTSVILGGTESLLTHRWREMDSICRLRQKSKVSANFGQPPYPVLYPGLSPIFVSRFWRVGTGRSGGRGSPRLI